MWYFDTHAASPWLEGPQHPTRGALIYFLLPVSSGVPRGSLGLAVSPGGLAELRKAVLVVPGETGEDTG